MVNPTSIQAYYDQVVEGRATTQRQAIYECLLWAAQPLTRLQIAERTGIRLSSVCGRVNAMLDGDRPLLMVSHIDVDPWTGKRAEYLMPILPKAKQMELTL